MAIRRGSSEHHWNYLLAIEDDLDRLSRYVEFVEENYKCFSIEIARILMAASAEVEVVGKQIADSNVENIHAVRDNLLPRFPTIPDFSVLIPGHGLTLHPWANWKNAQGVPDWWSGYNATKHRRHLDYHEANLHNALNAVAGLFVMTLHLYKDKAENGELRPSPRLLQAGPGFIRDSRWSAHGFSIVYQLDGQAFPSTFL